MSELRRTLPSGEQGIHREHHLLTYRGKRVRVAVDGHRDEGVIERCLSQIRVCVTGGNLDTL